MTVEINNKSDREVWLRYIAGDADALTELVEKYDSRLVAWLTVRKCADPEGICQDAWSKVIANRDSFDGRSFSGWVFKIAKNLFHDQLRKSKRRGEEILSPKYDVASDDILGLVRMEQQEMVQIVKKCMETVGEPFITAFQLMIDGARAKAIAEKFGVAEKTIYSRVHRAKKMIRECVDGRMP